MYFVGTRNDGRTFAVQSRDKVPADAKRVKFSAILPPGGKTNRMSFEGPDITVIPTDNRSDAIKRARALRS